MGAESTEKLTNPISDGNLSRDSGQLGDNGRRITTDSTEYDQADEDADMPHDDLTSRAAGYGVIAGKLKEDEECPLVLTFNPTSGTPQGVNASYVVAHSQRISTLSSASFIN